MYLYIVTCLQNVFTAHLTSYTGPCNLINTDS